MNYEVGGMKDENFKELQLKVDIDDLRSIYYDSGHGNVLFGASTKKWTILMISALIVFCIAAYFAVITKHLWIIVVGFIGLVVLSNTWWDLVSEIIKWKREANLFIKTARKVKSLRIQFNDELIVHYQDDSVLKIHWTEIKHAEINERYINLLFADSYMFLPGSSFAAEDYKSLSETVFSQVKNVRKDGLV